MRASFALLVALFLLPPFAAADHVYSHRYVVLVHVTGPEGAPVPDAAVAVEYGMPQEGPCAIRGTAFGSELAHTDGRTGTHGLAALCAHAHAFLPGATIAAHAAGTSSRGAADPALRLSVARHADPGQAGPPSDVLIHARAWRAGPTVLEGVAAEGTALPFLQVTATLRFTSGAEMVVNGSTDSYGDVLLLVPVPAGSPPAGTATLRAGDLNGTVPFERGFGSGSLPDAPPRPSRLALDPPAPAPTPLPALLAAAALMLGAWRPAR